MSRKVIFLEYCNFAIVDHKEYVRAFNDPFKAVIIYTLLSGFRRQCHTAFAERQRYRFWVFQTAEQHGGAFFKRVVAFADIDHKSKSTNSRRKDTSCQGYEECFWLSDTRYDEKNACGKAENAHGFFYKTVFLGYFRCGHF